MHALLHTYIVLTAFTSKISYIEKLTYIPAHLKIHIPEMTIAEHYSGYDFVGQDISE